MAMPLGGLQINVTANTLPFLAQVRSAAAIAGAQFSADVNKSMSRGLAASGTVRTVAKGAALAIGGITIAAAAFGVEAFKAAARVQAMQSALYAIGQQTGRTNAQMDAAVRSIAGMNIMYGTAQQTIATLARAHIDLARGIDLARVAQNFAVITNKQSSDVLAKLTWGIQTQNERVLRTAGATIQVKNAEADYAKQLGITAAHLTPMQKQQAVLNAVLENGKTVQNAYTFAMQDSGKVLNSLPRVFNNIAIGIGQQLLPMMNPLILGFYHLTTEFSKAVMQGGALAPVFHAMAQGVKPFTDALTAGMRAMTRWIDSLNASKVAGFSAVLRTLAPALLPVGTAFAILAGANVLRIAADMTGLGGVMRRVARDSGPLAKVLGKGEGGLLQAVLDLPLPVKLAGAALALLVVASPQARKSLQDIAVTLGQTLLVALQDIKPLLIGLAGTLGGTVVIAAQAVAPLLTAVAEALKAIQPILPGIVLGWVAYASAVKLAALYQGLLDLAMWDNPVTIWVTALALLVIGIIAAYQHIKPFRNAVDAVGRGIKDAAVAVGHFAEYLGTGFVQIGQGFAKAGKAVGEFFVNLGHWTAGAAGSVARFVTGIAGAIARFAVAMYRGAVDAGKSFWHGLTTTVTGVASWLYTNIIHPAGVVLATLGKILIAPFVYMIEFWTRTRAGQLVVRDVLMPVLRAILWFGTEAYRGAIHLGEAIFNGITAGITAVGGAAKWTYRNVIAPLVRQLVAGYKQIWNAMKTAAAWMWRGFAAGVGTVSAWIYKWILHPIGRAVATGATIIWNAAKSAAAWLWRGFAAGVGSISSWLTRNIINPVGRFLARIGSTLWNTMKSAAGWLWRGFTAGLGNIRSWIWAHVIGPIVNAFRGAPGVVATQGSNVIGGFLNGIWRGMKQIGSWVKRHILDPVVHWIKYWFGIRSPSTVMAGIGGNVIAGFLGGMIRGSKKLPGFIASTFGSLPRALLGLLDKGLIGAKGLPGKAISALRGLAGDATGWVKSAFGRVSGTLGHVLGGIWTSLFGGGAGPAAKVSAGAWFANLQSIARYMASSGWSPQAAAGIAGNIYRESGGNPLAQGSGGRGLIGWTPMSKLPDYAFVPGNASLSLSRQLPLVWEYFMTNLSGSQRAFVNARNRTAGEAALAIMNWGERPYGSNPNNPLFPGVSTAAGGIRAAMAQVVYNSLYAWFKRMRWLAGGGVISEPVFGVGSRTGTPYAIAERGPELVSPLTGPGGWAEAIAAHRTWTGAQTNIHVYPSQGMSEEQLAAAVSRKLAWAAASGAR